MDHEAVMNEILDRFQELPRHRQSAVLEQMQDEAKHELMTEAELCHMLRICRGTLYKYLRHGPPAGGRDVRKIRTTQVGGRKLYFRKSVEELLAASS